MQVNGKSIIRRDWQVRNIRLQTMRVHSYGQNTESKCQVKLVSFWQHIINSLVYDITIALIINVYIATHKLAFSITIG